MKSILYSICIGTLALALTASGEQVNGTASVKTKAKARGAASVQPARTGGGTVRSAGEAAQEASIARETWRSVVNETPRLIGEEILRLLVNKTPRSIAEEMRGLPTTGEAPASAVSLTPRFVIITDNGTIAVGGEAITIGLYS